MWCIAGDDIQSERLGRGARTRHTVKPRQRVDEGKGPVRPIGSISVLAIVGALALAGTASASTLAVNGGALRFDAGKGEANNVDLRDGGGQTTVTDSGSIIHAGNGCTQVTPHRGVLPAARGLRRPGRRHDAGRPQRQSPARSRSLSAASPSTAAQETTPSATRPSRAPTSTADSATTPSPCTPTSAGASTSTAASGATRSPPSRRSGTVDGGLGDDDITLTTFVNPVRVGGLRRPGRRHDHGRPGHRTWASSTAGWATIGSRPARWRSWPRLTGGFGDDRIISAARHQHDQRWVRPRLHRRRRRRRHDRLRRRHRPLRQVRGRHRQQLRDRPGLTRARPV